MSKPAVFLSVLPRGRVGLLHCWSSGSVCHHSQARMETAEKHISCHLVYKDFWLQMCLKSYLCSVCSDRVVPGAAVAWTDKKLH